MSLSFRMMLLAALVPLTAGCADMAEPVELAAPSIAQPAEPPLPAAPEPPPAFPAGRVDAAQAAILLAGDPMAQRFLALKELADKTLVPRDDAVARRASNIGALLPLTAPRPPAAGLDRPMPPVDAFVSRFAELGTDTPRGTDATRQAERAFLLDALLPKQPAQRQQYAPPDQSSARAFKERLGRLEDCGLVTPEERTAELAALDTLVASGTLPEVLAAAPPPEKPKAKAKAKGSATGRVSRMPGGVSGKLEVIPSPASVNAPPLPAGAKGPAGIHLLSMGTAAHGEKAWDALKKEHAELGELGYKVSRADLGDLGVTYRLIAGPVDPAQAEKLCAALKPRGQTCTPTPFPAQ